jgi:glycosyltransferase involved in cell wall biosynthesis
MSALPPMVSVVMPVYNSEIYLRTAIESILAQTFRNFELIAIDDGSTDGSASILDDFRRQDGRIIILSHLQNQGIVSALNRGLKIARGEYIARMDTDDISLPERFEKQVEFLETHPQVGVLGSDAIFMDSHGREIVRMGHPHEDLSIRWTSLLANVFFHPTVMIRRAILTSFHLGYQLDFQSVEDYDLWVRLLEHTQAANLDRPLLRYRVHAQSISSQSAQEQMEKHTRISFAYIQRLFPEIRLTRESHAMMVAAFTGALSASDNHQRPVLAKHYLELWQAFVLQHQEDPALKPLRHEAAILAAKIGLFPPFQPGWLGTARDLFSIDPLWALYFCIRLSSMITQKFQGLRLSHLRRAGL